MTEKDEVITIDNNEEEVLEEKTKKFTLTPITFLFTGITAAIILALLVHFVITPFIATLNAQDDLNNVKNSTGEITAVNTTLVTFQGQKIENANVQQKALGSGDKATTPAAFIFTNGKASNNRRIVDVYLDFSNQKSRDFLLMNQNNLKSMIEGGVIELRIHPVPTGNAFTIYSSEALAESFVTDPKKAWPFMYELMRMSAVLKTDSKDDILKAIEDTVKELNIKDIDKASIENGTFASWIISVGNDPNLKAGFYPPLVYVNGSVLDSNTLNLNDVDTLRREIMKR